jgi:hypothetical protein
MMRMREIMAKRKERTQAVSFLSNGVIKSEVCDGAR